MNLFQSDSYQAGNLLQINGETYRVVTIRSLTSFIVEPIRLYRGIQLWIELLTLAVITVITLIALGGI